MNFEEWWEKRYECGLTTPVFEAEFKACLKHARTGWNAALEHARDEFLQGEIERIMYAQLLGFQEWSIRKEVDEAKKCISWIDVLAALEYLKDQK